MTKRRIRENVCIMLFQTAFYQEDEWEEQADLFLESLEEKDATKKAKEQIKERFKKLCGYLPQIDQKISEKAKGWKLERLAKVDLAILRVAVYELFYDADVPNPVAINEAVELAKQYGEKKSGKFVNGVLAGIVKELQTEKPHTMEQDKKKRSVGKRHQRKSLNRRYQRSHERRCTKRNHRRRSVGRGLRRRNQIRRAGRRHGNQI